MRLINADAVLTRMINVMDMQDFYLPIQFMLVINEIPTIDPVRHGHWVAIDDYPHEEWECDKCGFVYYEDNDEPTFKYCPNCGAKMDEERREE